MKLLSIAGARPQFIKLAALHRSIVKENNLQHLILHTGQHYDYNLSAIFFKELEIPPPDFHLTINDSPVAASKERMQSEIFNILAKEMPDVVIVYGDTNSTIAGAMAAKKLNIKLAHVEAGLRSYDNSMPEELNRLATDKISDILFCPTKGAVEILISEGFDKSTIILSGDIMLDSMNYFIKKTGNRNIENEIVPTKTFILCTLHRQSLVESHHKLNEVVKALNEINKQTQILLPAHPRLRKAIDELDIEINFKIISAVGYLDMIRLLQQCTYVITDSGGLQKEAYFCRKMCVTVRENTEWKELVEAGVSFIAGDSSAEKIAAAYLKAITSKGNFENNFYGDGNAAKIIVENIVAKIRKDDA
ncbi:MAG TPA: UDP-N-acetylglucosamine 2-epimerase (non-hydrolyzing) [Chitinophagaceae bacterium]|nr:UDP-N-acetylglucosamine 2-epimerase (non-hydrolyzing) [Chitinophagaceae bacterium]